MRFDTKIAVLLRDDLETWQRLNVTAFLVSGIAASRPELIGEPYDDADGTPYLPMFRQPVLVFEGSKEVLAAAHQRAVAARAAGWRSSPPTCSTPATTRPTGPRSGRAARTHLDLVGLAVHGPKNAVDKVLKGAALHR